MTKFKILSWILKLFILFHILAFVMSAYTIYLLSGVTEVDVKKVIFSTLLYMPLGVLFAIGLYYIHQSCIMFLKRGYFNLKSSLYLKRGGYILGASALLSICSSVINHGNLTDLKAIQNFSENITYNILWLVVSFALIATTDILKKGVNLKRENDLTI